MDLYVKADKKADRFREPEKKSIWEKTAGGFKTANDIRKGFRKGVAGALFSTVEGIWNAVTHPIKTANGIVYAIGHPVETAKSIWKSISDSWKNDVINGDAKSRSEWFGRAVGEAALAIVGTKGVDKAVKVAKGARVVKEDGGARVVRPETIEKKESESRDGKPVTPERRDSGARVEKREVPQRIDGNGGIGDNSGKDTGKNSEIVKFTEEQLSTKPSYSRDPEKWQKKGGKIEISEDGIWTYIDWEVPPNRVSYPGGFPDFKSAGLVRQEVPIGEFKRYDIDFAKADELAPNGPKLDENTWHHYQDLTTMQEINKEMHRRFRHMGGMSLTKKIK
nr:HNH endonuclease [Bacillus sp. REN3]